MKNILTTILGLILILSISSCSEDYFDVNTPSTAANGDVLRMSDLLGPTIYHTVNAQYFAARNFGNYSQYFTGQGGVAIGKTSNAGTWSQIYLYTLPNLKLIKQKATEVNAIHYDAVANILIAMNIGLATDSWDWIPYKEASLGSENIQPGFDSQEVVYTEINNLLTKAIEQLNATDTSGFTLANDDIAYGGNLDKWKKLAYTLKARYSMHLMKINGESAAADAISFLANGFTSNDDDFQIYFEEKKMNPWYTREVLARQTSNAHDKIGDQLVSYMDGTFYPFEEKYTDTIIINDIEPFDPINNDTTFVKTIDPRLSIIAEKEDPLSPYRGYVSGGDGLSSDGGDGNANFKDGGFYTDLDSPITIISYAEALFIKAEAEFIIAGGDSTSEGTNATAYNAYKEAITANMNKLGVSANEYLSDTLVVSMGESNLKLEHIMKEKYIANFLNPETYNDLRRYSFSTDVYKGFELPEDHATSEYPDMWMLRAVYPESEETRNPDNVAAHKAAPTVPVWWN